MNTISITLMWSIFALLIISMLAIDLFLHSYRNTNTNTKQLAAIWSFTWVIVSLIFCAILWWYLSLTKGRMIADQQALAFLTGYLIEKALAIDNVFVWLTLFNYFAVPIFLQQRVLVYGTLGAIVLRTIMIFSGSWLINQLKWLSYILGTFLIFSGIKISFIENKKDFCGKSLIKWLCNHLRITNKIENNYFFIRKNGVIFATQLMLVLILVELSDVIFAIDSIPAIFAVTTNSFIILTSNLFAILGLRAMYFLIEEVAERFSMLKHGLSLILIFVGIKMLIVDFYQIPIIISLGIIFSILVSTTFINIWLNYQNNKNVRNSN